MSGSDLTHNCCHSLLKRYQPTNSSMPLIPFDFHISTTQISPKSQPLGLSEPLIQLPSIRIQFRPHQIPHQHFRPTNPKAQIRHIHKSIIFDILRTVVRWRQAVHFSYKPFITSTNVWWLPPHIKVGSIRQTASILHTCAIPTLKEQNKHADKLEIKKS